MPRLDMTAFPSLRNMSSDRDRAVSYARLRRSVEPGKSEVILRFWEEIGQNLQSEDDLEAMSRFVSELERDISLLQAIKETQSNALDDPQSAMGRGLVAQMLRMLIELLFQYKKRLWELKDQALRYYLMANPAMPSKVERQIEQDKEKAKGNRKPAGQAKAKKAVEEAKPPAKDGKKGQDAEKVQARPEKKMEP